MRNELNNLVTQVQDTQTRKVFSPHFRLISSATAFLSADSKPLFRRYSMLRCRAFSLSSVTIWQTRLRVTNCTSCRFRSVLSDVIRDVVQRVQFSLFSDWDKIDSPSKDQIVDYKTLPATTDASVLNKAGVSPSHDTHMMLIILRSQC